MSRPPTLPPAPPLKAELTARRRLGYNTSRPGFCPADCGAAVSADDQFRALVSGRATGAGPALARLGLWAASLPYGAAVRLRNRLFDCGWRRSHRAAVPVVSVGNLTLGGTGKTPCVEYLARFFRGRDVRVAILSRGYGGAGGPNDEALVLEDNLP